MDAARGLPLELVETAFEAAVSPQQWPQFLGRLAKTLDARALNLVVAYPESGTRGVAYCTGSASHFESAYLDRFLARDPWRDHARGLAEGTVAGNGALDPALEASGDFFREWMAPQELRHGLGAVLHKTNGVVRSCLVGFRSKTEGPFAAAECELLERLVPHLQRALAVQRELDAAREVRDAALETLDRMSEGWILLAGDGRILSANRSAKRVLDEGVGIASANGRLSIPEAGPAERIRQLLARAGGSAAGATGATLELSDARGAPMRVVATPIRGGATQAAAVLLVSGGAPSAAANAQNLRETYGLTHAEARVAGRLADGQRLSEIARDLGISINTVRGHLKQVFAKTGTHRQAELVRLVLSGPAEIQSAAS